MDEAGQVSHYVAVFSDITLIKEKEQRLEQLAHFDQLTGNGSFGFVKKPYRSSKVSSLLAL